MYPLVKGKYLLSLGIFYTLLNSWIRKSHQNYKALINVLGLPASIFWVEARDRAYKMGKWCHWWIIWNIGNLSRWTIPYLPSCPVGLCQTQTRPQHVSSVCFFVSKNHHMKKHVFDTCWSCQYFAVKCCQDCWTILGRYIGMKWRVLRYIKASLNFAIASERMIISRRRRWWKEINTRLCFQY